MVKTKNGKGILDGNEAAAYVAYRANEVIAIYPITPSSPMGELADQWSAAGIRNVWGTTPRVVEMQSEGGAAGAVHGALQAGCLATTFTASQGLLLMIPNMYKIAGELTSTVFHVAARSVATHALSIFGDHSDVMATRATGWAMLFAGSVQETMDLALVAHASTLAGRIPFLHVFDGFRTSHEIQKIDTLAEDDLRAMIDDERVRAHRGRALTPEHPVIRGTAQNPDVFFQGREAVNTYYLALPQIVQAAMDTLGDRVGRHYRLFEYAGAPDADRVIVLMGSGCETAHEAVEHLVAAGEKVGVVKVRLFRPFSTGDFLDAIPKTVTRIAALDRTKEPGSVGEPLYQDVVTAVAEGMASGTLGFARHPLVVGGRYGLGSKEFTPAMVKGIFDELARPTPKNHFTVGIIDDVTGTGLAYPDDFDTESPRTRRAVFWGLGSDGTVGANRNSVRIIGEATANHVQGYFVYDSRKAGARTMSHLRFGPAPIRSTYLIQRANFVAVHQFGFLEKYDTLGVADTGATFLLNSPYRPEDVWEKLPTRVQRQIIDKRLEFYVVDAYAIAKELKMGVRINTIMQAAFFALADVMPRESAMEAIKKSIRETYGKRGEIVVRQNSAAVEVALSHVRRVAVPEGVTDFARKQSSAMDAAPTFVREVIATILEDRGDLLPVSAFPPDGTFPSGTTRWEKRGIAQEVPVWEPDLCIQCGKCVMVCPHSTIRAKVVNEGELAGAPPNFKWDDARWRELAGKKYTLQVAGEDCTGCRLCVEICPAMDKSHAGRRALNMAPRLAVREQQRENWEFFLRLPEVTRSSNGNGSGLKFTKAKDVQLLEPLFEFSSACAGCGETPYLRLLGQLFGDRSLIANATGCSSIFCGNLPTAPWAQNREGRGPAWSNSLFEDNAEFGLGMRLALDKQGEFARDLLIELRQEVEPSLARDLLEADQTTEAEIAGQRRRVAELKAALENSREPAARDLISVADALVRKSVWIVGGDGWAYDIGYGGLDHVLASGRNVNVLVLDTEVYSNTGGQASKATPLGAVAKFAAEGKTTPKKDLGRMAMSYGHVYVAQVALGADENHVIKAFEEAEAYDGPSLIVAYCQCIAHGIDMAKGMQQQALAVASGYWPLYRYNPALKESGKHPLQIDSKPPKISLQEYIYNESRYAMLRRARPDVAADLLGRAQRVVDERWSALEHMAGREEE